MPLRSALNKIVVIGIVAMQVVCTIGCNNDDSDEVAGPCYHEYLTPVIEIYSVTDSETGEELESFRISEIIIDDEEQELSSFTYEPSYGVELIEQSLICEIPCGFGTIEGDYVVVILADGYLTKTIQFEAFYEEFLGGCPSFNEGATRVAVTMNAM